MQFRRNSTFSNVFLTAFLLLLTWTSLAQGAAINRDSLLAKRDVGNEARASWINDLNGDILRRDGIVTTTGPEGETFVGRDIDGAEELHKEWYTLGTRTADEKTDETLVEDKNRLSKRWYTLVEIAEAPEDE